MGAMPAAANGHLEIIDWLIGIDSVLLILTLPS